MARIADLLAGLRRADFGPWLILAGMAVLVAVWAGPVRQARAAAEAQLREARSLNAWVAGQVALAPPEAVTAAEGVPVAGPIGLGAVERSLVAAGLREQVTRLANAGGGGISIAFDDVPFAPLMVWLEASLPVWGYDLAQLRVTAAAEPGRVAVLIEAEVPR